MDKHDRSCLNNLSLRNPCHFLALGFGSGLLPKAPGTYGSLAAVPLCIALIYADLWIQLSVCILVFLLGWVRF